MAVNEPSERQLIDGILAVLGEPPRGQGNPRRETDDERTPSNADVLCEYLGVGIETDSKAWRSKVRDALGGRITQPQLVNDDPRSLWTDLIVKHLSLKATGELHGMDGKTVRPRFGREVAPKAARLLLEHTPKQSQPKASQGKMAEQLRRRVPEYYPEDLDLVYLSSTLRLSTLDPERLKQLHMADTSPLYNDAGAYGDVEWADAIDNHRALVILGNPGGGKSTLMAAAALRHLEAAELKGSRVAAFCSAIDLADVLQEGPAQPSLQLARACNKWSGLDHDDELAEFLTNDPGVHVGIDGWDEVTGANRRELVEGFLGELKIPGRVVVASRVTGYRPLKIAGEHVPHFRVADLRFEHFKHLATRWLGETDGCTNMLAAIEASDHLTRLAASPVTAGFLCLNAQSGGSVQENFAELYSRVVDLLIIQDWRRPGTSTPHVGGPDSETVLKREGQARDLAYWMSTRPPNEKPQWRDHVTLREINAVADASLALDHGLLVPHGRPDALPIPSHVTLPSQQFRWLHKTLQEHLTGSVIAERFEEDPDATWKCVRVALRRPRIWFVTLAHAASALAGTAMAEEWIARLDEEERQIPWSSNQLNAHLYHTGARGPAFDRRVGELLNPSCIDAALLLDPDRAYRWLESLEEPWSLSDWRIHAVVGAPPRLVTLIEDWLLRWPSGDFPHLSNELRRAIDPELLVDLSIRIVEESVDQPFYSEHLNAANDRQLNRIRDGIRSAGSATKRQRFLEMLSAAGRFGELLTLRDRGDIHECELLIPSFLNNTVDYEWPDSEWLLDFVATADNDFAPLLPKPDDPESLLRLLDAKSSWIRIQAALEIFIEGLHQQSDRIEARCPSFDPARFSSEIWVDQFIGALNALDKCPSNELVVSFRELERAARAAQGHRSRSWDEQVCDPLKQVERVLNRVSWEFMGPMIKTILQNPTSSREDLFFAKSWLMDSGTPDRASARTSLLQAYLSGDLVHLPIDPDTDSETMALAAHLANQPTSILTRERVIEAAYARDLLNELDETLSMTWPQALHEYERLGAMQAYGIPTPLLS